MSTQNSTFNPQLAIDLAFLGVVVSMENLDVPGSPVQRTVSITRGANPMQDSVTVNTEWLATASEEEFTKVMDAQRKARYARIEAWLEANPPAWSDRAAESIAYAVSTRL